MAVVTLTVASPRNWLDAFLGRELQPKKRKRRRQKGFLYRFHTPHRQTAGNNGPGRKTKTNKNSGITHLHSNRLGVK